MLLQTIIKYADATVDRFVFGAWRLFEAEYGYWVVLSAALFIAITALLVVVGRVKASTSELIPRALKVLIVMTLVLNADTAMRGIYNVFTVTPSNIGSLMIRASYEAGPSPTPLKSPANINAAMDALIDRGFDASKKVWSQAGVTNPAGLLGAAALLIATIFIASGVLYIILLAKFATAVLLAIAPFFIVLYVFDASRSLFEGWLRQTLSFALIPPLIYGVFALWIVVIEAFFVAVGVTFDGPNIPTFRDIFIYGSLSVVTYKLTKEVQGWAAGIAGGFSLSTSGSFSADIGQGIHTAANRTTAAGTLAQRSGAYIESSSTNKAALTAAKYLSSGGAAMVAAAGAGHTLASAIEGRERHGEGHDTADRSRDSNDREWEQRQRRDRAGDQ